MSALPATYNEPPRVVMPAARTGAIEVEQARVVAEAQATMLIARRFPRNEVEARDKILNDFASISLAEKAQYSYAKGGTSIDGPSIHALMAIARRWGNLDCGIEELARHDGYSECRAFAIDLESGTRDSRKFIVRHIRDTKQGGKPLSDERELYELVANMGARRKRSCLEGVIPKDVIDMAMNQAAVTMSADFEVTADRLKKLVEKFAEFGVTQQMIEKRIQRHIDAMTPAQMFDLGKKYTSLKDGMSEPGDWFDTAASTTQAAPAAKGTEGVKEKMRTRSRPAEMAPSPEPAASAEGGPEPITDEVKALLAIDNAADEGEGSGVIDRCKGQAFYAKVVEAFNARFRTTL